MKIGDKVIERNSKRKGVLERKAFSSDWWVRFGDRWFDIIPCNESELILQPQQLEFNFMVEDVTTTV